MASIREQLLLKLGIEGSDEFGRKLKKAKGDAEGATKGIGASFKDLAKSAAVVGAAIGAALTAAGVAVYKLASQVASLGDSWDKMAKRTGLAAETLSALSFAADRSGTSINSLEVGFRRLAANMQDAAKGTGIAKESFDKLGVTVTDSEGRLKSQDALLYELADSLGQWSNSAEKAAMAQDIFGRSGVEMLPMLAEGSKGIKDLMGRAEELGEVFSGKLARDSAAYEDAVRDMEGAVQGLKNAVGQELIPELTRLTNEVLTPLTVKMRGWVDTYRSLKGALNEGSHVGVDVMTMDRLRDAGILSGRGRGQGQGLLTAGRRDEGTFRTPTTAERVYALPGGVTPAVREMQETVTAAVRGADGSIIGFEQVLPKMKEQLTEVAETGVEAFEKIPMEMGDGFGDALQRVEAQMQALGLKGQGIFGGIANVRAGFSGLTNTSLQLPAGLTSSLQNVAGLGQAFVGGISVLKGLGSLFASKNAEEIARERELALLTSEEQIPVEARNALEDARTRLANLRAVKNAPGLGWQLGIDPTNIDAQIAAQEDRIRGMQGGGSIETGERFYSSVATTMTDSTGASILASINSGIAIAAENMGYNRRTADGVEQLVRLGGGGARTSSTNRSAGI